MLFTDASGNLVVSIAGHMFGGTFSWSAADAAGSLQEMKVENGMLVEVKPKK
jgi:hypothetical protein